MKKVIVLLLLLLSILGHVRAQDYLVGVRGGSSFESDAGYFRQADVFAGRNLPWQWDSYLGLSFKPRVEASAGWLSGGQQDGFVGTLGPVIELREGKIPVTLEGGASPTLLSRYNFSERDLGAVVLNLPTTSVWTGTSRNISPWAGVTSTCPMPESINIILG
jgi:hypothetical protein